MLESIIHKAEIFSLVHNYYIANKAFFDEMSKANPQAWSDPEHRIMRQILSPNIFQF